MYLKLNAFENKSRFEEDYRILIPWDAIRERIISRENFIKKYPDFPENEEVRKYLEGYIGSYLGGLDNSKITNYPNDNKLKPDIKNSYEKFIVINKTSSYYKLVLDYYNLLRQHNFIVGEYVNVFLKKRGFSPTKY
jgi:hypothetical protein